MLVTIAILLVLTALGIPFILLQKQPKDFVFAPTLGLAALVAIAYIISASIGISGSQAVAISLSILFIFAVIVLIRTRGILWVNIKKELRLGGFCLLLGLLILLPAIFTGPDMFFGVVNYDFFYNSQDSNYLCKHSVLQYASIEADQILPLTWSVAPQGRFAISLIGAFAEQYLGLDPLHFNAELLATLVLLFSLSAGGFVKHIFPFSGYRKALAISAIVLSAGFVLGYVYFLLGQISALPLFIIILTFASRLMEHDNEGIINKNNRWYLFAIIFLLNSLYFFYAILAFFAIVIISVALVFRVYLDSKAGIKIICRFGCVLLGFALLFVLARIFFLESTIDSIMAWAHLSVKTAAPSASSSTPMVFGEYLIEGFIGLLFGVLNYPISFSFFHYFPPSSWVIHSYLTLAIGLMVVIAITWAMFGFIKSSKQENTAIILALITIISCCAVVFFITKSGYAIFKIGCWFVPLVLPICVGPISWPKRGKKFLVNNALSCLCMLIIFMNWVAAASYLVVFVLDNAHNPFDSAKAINGYREFSVLALQSASETQKKVILDLSDGIKNAWAANEFRSAEVSALTHNYQPLFDRFPPTVPCQHSPVFTEDAILINERGKQSERDVIHDNDGAKPIMMTDHYSMYRLADIDTYAFLGRGAYQLEHFSDRTSRKYGLPKDVRWVESGVEVFVYSRRPQIVDVNISVLPGYVNAPKNRELTVNFRNKIIKAGFSNDNRDIHLQNMTLNAGLNCFYIESKDSVSLLKRKNGIIRPEISGDFRLLNFALSQFSIQK